MISLVSLNIEGGRHLERVLPFLKEQQADVVCLLEVFQKDVTKIEAAAGCKGHFIPMHTKDEVNESSPEARGIQGILFLTTLKHATIEAKYYFGEGNIPKHINADKGDRVLVYTTVEKEGETFTVGCTHFSWTKNGEANKKQREDLQALFKVLPSEIVFCGDFNAPRGKEIYTKLAECYIDNLPSEIENTLDPKYHRKEGLCLAVDSIFSTPEYKVSDVKVIDGLSDHCALTANISKK